MNVVFGLLILDDASIVSRIGVFSVQISYIYVFGTTCETSSMNTCSIILDM